VSPDKVAEKPIMVTYEIISERSAHPEYHEPSEAIDPNELSKHYAYEKHT